MSGLPGHFYLLIGEAKVIENLKADQEDTMEIQFDNSSQFVYTYEILTWLSIREKIGLKNPEKFTHPLMGLVLNKLPTVVAGGWAGAELGAIIGTAICPGVGTVIGGVLGGVIGGIAGSSFGKAIADWF
jgi:uncharacterized membrane protein